jgi:cell division protease FtsH
MNPNFRNFALWVIIFLLVLALVTLFQNPGQRSGGGDIAYSQLLTEAENGRISNVVISGNEISGTYTDGRTFTTYAPFDPSLVSKLSQKGVQITARPPSDNTPWFIALLVNWLPIPSSSAPGSSSRARCSRAPAAPWASASPRPSF